MNTPNIIHKFNENSCEIKIPIPRDGQTIANCDIFIDESNLIFVCDSDVSRFKCTRKFDLLDMKNISISFNNEQWEYACILPCFPDEPSESKIINKIEKGESEKKSPEEEKGIRQFKRITDSCVLSVDGKICDIEANFPYGFCGRYRGRPKYNEDDLFHICRITDPSSFSVINRTIMRENDETKDFCPDQYKLNFVELQLPEGHENPIKYCIPFDDAKLTKEDEWNLEYINSKHEHMDVEKRLMNIDCGLVSILLGICYDVRLTSNDPTCESAWTRTILSPVLSYFEHFDNLSFVIESFLRRSLIYPLYRSYDLARLCVQDAVEALQRGKSWILKQLLITYNCFIEADRSRKALNKYFIKHYIWYVDKIIDDDHLQMLATNLKNVLLLTTKKDLRLGLAEIEFELLRELIGDIHLSKEVDETSSSSGSGEESSSECESGSENETD